MKEIKISINDEDVIELKKVFKTDNDEEAVRMAVNEAIKKQSYNRILALKGKVEWDGNLDEMRESRT